ncbi:MAG TPA: 3-carboxy-cis,cis-muconate cycloisomerase, partial [Burkholderiaceae bacterium]|nr:3-carboxy-cis,cis-muconate cycloisomerase [Burkholderiaceae bacterium]
IGELAEPSGRGRGSSASMPQKRNPVASLAALAAAERTPFRAAALLASMSQEHERGLGAWHAEIAEWPGLLLSAHGAVRALAEAIDGLRIDAERMQRNIDATRGLVFAEAVAMHLARTIGRVRAHALIEDLAAVAERSGRAFEDLIVDAVESDATLTRAFGERARATLHALFDSDAAARLAGTRARERLAWLHAQQASLPAAPWEPSAPASV